VENSEAVLGVENSEGNEAEDFSVSLEEVVVKVKVVDLLDFWVSLEVEVSLLST
jgi:hypothetical protein